MCQVKIWQKVTPSVPISCYNYFLPVAEVLNFVVDGVWYRKTNKIVAYILACDEMSKFYHPSQCS